MTDWNKVELDTPAIILGARKRIKCAMCGAEPGANCQSSMTNIKNAVMPDFFAHVYRRMDYYEQFGSAAQDVDDLLGEPPAADSLDDLLG